jgi:hypothetical protein
MRDPEVTHNEAEHRFEIQLGDQRAMLVYELRGNDIALVHTEVPRATVEGASQVSSLKPPFSTPQCAISKSFRYAALWSCI